VFCIHNWSATDAPCISQAGLDKTWIDDACTGFYDTFEPETGVSSRSVLPLSLRGLPEQAFGQPADQSGGQVDRVQADEADDNPEQ
jgi:hypothetical protein